MSDVTLAVAVIGTLAVAVIGVIYMSVWAVVFEIIKRKKW